MEIWNKMNNKEQLQEYGYAILGAIVYAVGFNMLIVPLELYSGGFMGISQIINWIVVNLFKITIPSTINLVGVIYYAINIPLFYMAYRIMSKQYAFRSLFIVTVLSAFFVVVPVPAAPIVEDLLTGSIIGGIICGVGGGFILRGRMAGGGQDIIGVCFAKRYPDFSVGKVSIAVNVVVFGFCLFIYDIQMVVYSLIFTIVYCLAIDKVHVQNIKTSVMIFTKQKGIAEEIMTKMRRGVTKWDGEGAYTHQESDVLFVVVSKYEIPQIKKIVRTADPHAFIICMEGCSVDGNFEKRL